jgi:hypothetical protein
LQKNRSSESSSSYKDFGEADGTTGRLLGATLGLALAPGEPVLVGEAEVAAEGAIDCVTMTGVAVEPGVS